MNLRKLATALVAIGMAAGLIGAGVAATYTDSATATLNQAFVGNFGCEISSTTPGAVVSADRHSVTYSEAEIQSSAPPQGGNALNLSVTVKNVGSMAAKLHWTIVGPDYNNPPGGNFGTSSGNPSMLNDVVPFAPGASMSYTGLGFMWLTPLTNADLDRTLTATYTATCTDFNPAAIGRPQFVAGASAAGLSVALPSGWQPGDLAVAYNWRSGSTGSAAVPTGYTSIGIANIGGMRGGLAFKVLAAGDTAATVSTGNGIEVLVYRHAAVAYNPAIPAYLYTGASATTAVPFSCNMPANQPAGGLATDGSAVVACVAGDAAATNVAAIAPTPFGAAPNPALSNRSAGFTGANTGAADTSAAAVTAWPTGGTTYAQWTSTPNAARAHQTMSVALVYAP